MKTLRMLFLLSAAIFLAFSLHTRAQNPTIIEINPFGGTYYLPGDAMYGEYYFVADDGTHGRELWKLNVDLMNAALVRDIFPGASNGVGGRPTNCGGTLFLMGYDGTMTGWELWKSDGNSGGTILVKDIWTEKNIQRPSMPTLFTFMNGVTYFSAIHKYRKNPPAGQLNESRDLFRTDGTAAGTYMVKELNKNSHGGWPSSLTVWNNILYFLAYHTAYNGYRLTRSDGTASGTYMVYPHATAWGGNPSGGPLPVNNMLFFQADDGTHGTELWKSDGTQAGTSMLKDINPSGTCSPNYLVDWNGMLFFTATDGVHGIELWRSDGTTNGTFMVADINPNGGSEPYWLTPAGNVLYFTAIGPSTDDPAGPKSRQLWKSDGTAQGTVRVATVNQAGDCEPVSNGVPPACYNSNGNTFPVVNGKIFFRATDGLNGIELWTSDGTAAGTHMVKEIYQGAIGSDVKWLKRFGDRVLFIANHPAYGEELWVLDPAQPISKGRAAMESDVSADFALEQNYPNPLVTRSGGPATTIRFNLPETDMATLRVFDMLGREVATLAKGFIGAGRHQASWSPQGAPSGMYLCRLDYRGRSLTRVMHVVK